MADLVLDPSDPELRSKIMQFTDGKGVDAALETAGLVQAQRLCIDVTRRRGKISLIGECSEDLAVQASADFIRKGIALMGQWHYNRNGAFTIMKMLADSPVAAKLITHVLPMSKFQDAMQICADHHCGKIILKPWEA